MTDDTEDSDDVVMARIALLDYHIQRGLLFPGMDERNFELHRLIDAYAAAVRAEHRLTVVKLRDDETAPVAAPCAIAGACQYNEAYENAKHLLKKPPFPGAKPS